MPSFTKGLSLAPLRPLDTKFTEGLEGLAPFLHEAAKKVEAIDGR